MDLQRFIRKKELIDLTTGLVRIPTENPPGNEKNICVFLKPILRKLGFKVSVYISPQKRWSIVAERRWGKEGRTLIFNGHLDVVPAGDPSQWKDPPFKGVVKKGRIYGRGTSDMKSGISSFLHAVSAIDRSPIRLDRGSLVLHLVADEECHSHQGMSFLNEKGLIRGDAVIVGEPSNLNPVVAQKGAIWLRISTFGKSAHGSRPHLGLNAIEKMVKVIEQLKAISLEMEHPLLGKPTVNIGTIHGGTKTNIVPDRCQIEVDRRLLPGEKKDGVIQKVRGALEALRSQDSLLKYEIEESDYAEPCETDSGEEIVRIGLEAIEKVRGERPAVKGFAGFTDVRFYVQQYHIPGLILGPGDNPQAHTRDESVGVEALVQGAEIYALMILNFLTSR